MQWIISSPCRQSRPEAGGGRYGSSSTLNDIIRHGAEAYGEQTAFRYKVKKEIIDKSYNEVNLDSMAVSRAVEALGMKGKHIAVIGTTSYQWIITYFGIVNSGSVAVPIDAQLPAEAVCELLNRADVEMLVYDELRSDVAGVVREMSGHQACGIHAGPGDGGDVLSPSLADSRTCRYI